MNDNDDKGLARAAVGIGLALGGIALAGFMSSRQKQNAGDAPRHVRKSNEDGYAITGRTVTIAKPRDEIYKFWRDFSNLPKVMENVEEVRSTTDKRSVWVIKAPAGQTVEVETEVTQDTSGEIIAWESVEGSDISTRGEMRLADAPGDRGTRVTLVVEYDPPAGELGRLAAKLFQREPQIQARHDLKRLKMYMETGEIATSARRKEDARFVQQENA